MSQDNQFYQYGYDHYLKAPKKAASAPASRHPRGLRDVLGHKLRSPAVATVALLSAGAMFATVIFMSYPSGKEAKQPIPVIKADLTPIKEAPIERGGMDIPQRESTILAQVGQPSVEMSMPEVENLLAQTPEELMNKEKALEAAMNAHPMMPEDGSLSSPSASAVGTVPPSAEHGDDVIAMGEMTEKLEGGQIDIAEISKMESPEMPDLKEPKPLFDPTEISTEMKSVNVEPVVEKDSAKTAVAGNILQKIGSTTTQPVEVGAFAKMSASAALARKPRVLVSKTDSAHQKPSQMHAAAQSPETLEFVRSVLSSSAEDLNDIEPAAGAAPKAADLSPNKSTGGDVYFVQLASITDPARAGSEWGKMKAQYVSLSASDFRVQEAKLSGGTFYRIQAGPMSKAQADDICASLKQAGKPGGCLVVK